MKKVLYLTLFFALSLSLKLFAGIQSTATATGMDKSVTLHLPAAYNNEYVYCGSIAGTADGNPVIFYCIDLLHNLPMNTAYNDEGSTISTITYILNNFYPYKTFPYANSLSDINQEAAAIQLAIWNQSDNLDVTTVSIDGGSTVDAAIKARAQSIIAETVLKAGSIQPFNTLQINFTSQSFTVGTPATFDVETYNELGIPLPNAQISLSVNEGTLSTYTTTTNASGVSPTITLTAGPNNNTTITATAICVIPNGIQYWAAINPGSNQKLVIASPVKASKTITANCIWMNQVNLAISKTCATVTVNNGDQVQYKISVTNTGTVAATGIQISDVMPAILDFISSDGPYSPTTHIWTLGNLAVGQTETLTINAKADFTAPTASYFDLGPVADFNTFILTDLNQPSSDTQGKLAVGNNAVLANYSVGDKLASNSGNVLVVGRKLTFTGGRVYNGDIAYGSFIDTTICNSADGKIVKASPIDFTAASLYVNSLSQQLSVLIPNGTITYSFGHLALTGTSTTQNKFFVSGSDLSTCNDFTIDAPAGSLVIINVSGTSVSWTGGMELTGVKNENIIINFYEAKILTIHGIALYGSVLAPLATLNFSSGTIYGQTIANNCNGEGQFNWIPFSGKVSIGQTITNVATLVHVDQPLGSAVQNAMSQVKSNFNLTGVKNNTSTPPAFELMQNYPNPFNPTTSIGFSIPEAGNYTLKVYNVIGQEVATLVAGQLAVGSHLVKFDAGRLASGLYIYRLSGNNLQMTKKMILMK
jgi:choice-of-anchor A domain-containing protein/uncharacterized repeat protein (TIGR01451 family)